MLLADERVSSVSSAGNVLWPLADHLGTIRDIADYDEGDPDFEITNHRVYDSFGRLESETISAVDLAFGFTGKYTDEDTGHTHHLNRWYDPATGRWLSEDPIGFAAGDTNLSRYVGNGPVSSVDSMGLFEQGMGYDGYSATATAAMSRDLDLNGGGGNLSQGSSVLDGVITIGPPHGTDPEYDIRIGRGHTTSIDRSEVFSGGTTQGGVYNGPSFSMMEPPYRPPTFFDPSTWDWDGIQGVLDVGGFLGPIGPFADAANAVISAVRGKFGEAAINVVAIAPFFGDGIKYLLRGMNNPTTRAAVEQGQEAHRQFRKLVNGKDGWRADPVIRTQDGKILRPTHWTQKAGRLN